MLKNKELKEKSDLKVINIKTEILFREAEDEFYYFNRLNNALKKLREAIKYTPDSVKCLLLAGDISYIKGNIKQALKYYKTAEQFRKSDLKIQASIANCEKSFGNYETAFEYCEKAIKNFKGDFYELYIQILELRAEILIAQNNVSGANRELSKLKNSFGIKLYESDETFNFKLLNSLIESRKKVLESKLKVI